MHTIYIMYSMNESDRNIRDKIGMTVNKHSAEASKRGFFVDRTKCQDNLAA